MTACHPTEFHKKHRKPPESFSISLNGVTLERAGVTKFLGVVIQENREWNPHIEYICNKVSGANGILAKLKYYVPKYVLCTIYNSLCMSHISYAMIVLASSYKSSIKILEILLKKGIRHVCNGKYNCHTDPLFKECKILIFDDLRKINSVKIMYKKTQGKIHKYHSSKLKLKSEISNIKTRHMHDDLITGNKHTDLYKINSLNYKVATAWNELPLSLKETSSFSISTFTKHTKCLYLSNYSNSHKYGNNNCYICKDLN